MEFLVVLVVAVFFAPLVISIIALTKGQTLRRKIHILEEKINTLEDASKNKPITIVEEEVEIPVITENQVLPQVPPPPPEIQQPAEIYEEVVPPEAPIFNMEIPPPQQASQPVELPTTAVEHEPSDPPEWKEFITKLIFHGNPIAKIAIIILIFGVGFAIKLAALKGLFPLELRLIIVAVSGAIMTLIGLKLREKERTYAKILMGGGMTIVYLTFFGAGRLWHLLPISLALLLMIGCVVCATGLSHFIKSQSMAILSFSGGFLAPLLISTGSRNHIQLFTLYLVFNIAILFLSKTHNWRWLAVFGFFCTYVLGSIWGISDYHHRHLPTTEPFLIANWLIYLFAGHFLSLRRHKVIVTLILGPTLASFGMQSMMLENHLTWLAISCIVAGLVHAGYGFWLHRKKELIILKEFHRHIALGLVTLSIPLAFTERWTSAAWSVEALALMWIGLRSQRWILKISGLGLLFASGASLALDWPTDLLSQYLGCFLIAFSSLFCARLTYKTGNKKHDAMFWLTFLWSTIWLFSGLEIFIDRYFQSDFEGLIIAWSIIVLLSQTIGLKWKAWSFLFLWGIPLIVIGVDIYAIPLNFTVLTPALFLLALGFWTLTQWKKPDHKLHAFLNLILIIFLGITLAFWMNHFLIKSLAGKDWIAWLYPACLSLVFLPTLLERVTSPWSILKGQPQLVGLLLLAPLGVWFSILSLISPADFSPLPFITVLNPAELMLIGFTAMVLIWWKNTHFITAKNAETNRVFIAFCIALAFSFSLGLVSRFAHHYWSISWDFEEMFGSSRWQTALAIVWTLFGIAGLMAGSKKKSRAIWMAGATITGLVVVKLFLVDLRFSGTGPRVITFLAVGLLLLIVGYLAPWPGTEEDEIDPTQEQ